MRMVTGLSMWGATRALRGACIGLSLTMFACASLGGGDLASSEAADAGADSRVVARVETREITVDDIDQRIKDDLFEEAFAQSSSRLHDARTETVNEMIDEIVLARASEDLGLTPAEWREQVTADGPRVTDEEVEAFFEQNRERLSPGDTLEGLAPNIRRYLELMRQQEVLTELRGSYEVWIGLDRPRLPVGTDGPSIGPPDAPITIVEFSDYQCPYCSRAEPVIKEVLRRYPEQVRVVYRHLPLPFHPDAQGAAEASICAWAQDKFWEYHDLLFENQKALGEEQLVAYADQVGLDGATFAACLEETSTAERVRLDMAEAESLGATGTPTFFINGMMLTGSRPIEDFEAVIDEELARLGG